MSLSKAINKTNRYWLVFKEGGHWTQRFLKKDFGHVFILTKDTFNWIKIDPKIDLLEVEILPVSALYNVPNKFASAGFIVLEVDTSDIKSMFAKIVVLYCISVVRYTLGINIFAITPYGLYKKLLKMMKANKYKGGVKKVKQIR